MRSPGRDFPWLHQFRPHAEAADFICKEVVPGQNRMRAPYFESAPNNRSADHFSFKSLSNFIAAWCNSSTSSFGLDSTGAEPEAAANFTAGWWNF